MDKSNAIFIVLVILIGVAVFFIVKNDKAPEDVGKVQISQSKKSNETNSNVVLAPEISGVTPEGKTLNVRDFKGKVVVVDFWASWCAPCRQFIPTLVDLYSRYKDKGLEIVGVYVDNRDPNLVNMRSIKKQFSTSWHQIVGQGAFESARRYNVMGIPHIALIAKDGSIVMQNVRDRYDIEKYIIQELNK